MSKILKRYACPLLEFPGKLYLVTIIVFVSSVYEEI